MFYPQSTRTARVHVGCNKCCDLYFSDGCKVEQEGYIVRRGEKVPRSWIVNDVISRSACTSWECLQDWKT